MSRKEKVIAEIMRDPHRDGRAIATAAGCSRAHVSAVALREGLTYGRRLELEAERCQVVGFLSRENFDWLWDAAQDSGVSVSDMLDGVVTDARLEEERRGEVSDER